MLFLPGSRSTQCPKKRNQSRPTPGPAQTHKVENTVEPRKVDKDRKPDAQVPSEESATGRMNGLTLIRTKVHAVEQYNGINKKLHKVNSGYIGRRCPEIQKKINAKMCYLYHTTSSTRHHETAARDAKLLEQRSAPPRPNSWPWLRNRHQARMYKLCAARQSSISRNRRG